MDTRSRLPGDAGTLRGQSTFDGRLVVGGLEDAPDRCAEICVAEILGDGRDSDAVPELVVDYIRGYR